MRHYLYGILEDGSKEFIHTFLDPMRARNFKEDFQEAFPSKYEGFWLGTAQQVGEMVNKGDVYD